MHNFAPQRVTSSLNSTTPETDTGRKEVRPMPSTSVQSATKSESGPGKTLGVQGGQPKETGNEPVFPNGKPTTSDQSQQPQAEPDADSVDWSSFAYVQYVTNRNYLCNSLMILEALHRLGTKAERIMMYPEQWQIPETTTATTEEARFLKQARDQYKAKLVPIQVVTFADRGDQTWKDSYTKLLAFNQTQYKRVISLDSDAIVQQVGPLNSQSQYAILTPAFQTMDELFLLPSTPIAMPRAYWLDQPFLSSQLAVIEPSTTEWNRISKHMDSNPEGGFDMDILNTLYGKSALVLPHRRYDLLTAEFRKELNQHEPYLGSKEKWNGTKVVEEAKYVHFSDWPVRKPWLVDDEGRKEQMPKCVEGKEGKKSDCTNRDIWVGFYKGYKEKRKEICGREYDLRKRESLLKRRAQMGSK